MKNRFIDAISGLAVFVVAIPLCLGIALASGAPMTAGLLSGIIGGVIIGALSGSNFSVSGPAAGLAAIVLTAIVQIGSFEAFLAAVILAGFLQLVLAFFKAGEIGSFFPTAVIRGLLAGIGFILILKQLPHALGYDADLEGDLEFSQFDHENTFSEILRGLENMHFGAILIAIVGLLIMMFWKKSFPKQLSDLFPSSVIVIVIAIVMNEIFKATSATMFIDSAHLVRLPEGLTISTVGMLFTKPDFSAFGNPLIWKFGLIIAVVASLETIFNIEATDKLDPAGHKTPLNRELLAQGIGNMLSGFAGGMPITSVIVRSSVNIQAGAKSKWSTIFHGMYLLVFILLFPGLLSKIPLSALAAILMYTGYKLISPKEFNAFYDKGWDQFVPFIVTILAIVFTDLLIGVSIGLVFSIFFILRSNFRNPFVFIREEYQNRKILKLELSQQVSFFHKAALEKTLDSVADNSNVLIDGTRTDFLDHDVREALESYREHGVSDKTVNMSFTGFDKKHNIRDEINFPYVLTKELLDSLTPDDVLGILKKGNARFVNGKSQKKDLLRQVRESSASQHPMSVILACIDSRSATELIFDQGFGDIVSIRIAGNVVNEDILGSIEFACHVLGAKLLLVLGHTNCGAVKAALGDTPDGNIGPLVEKIKKSLPNCSHHADYGDKVTELSKENVFNSIEEIKKDSSLQPLLENNQLKIVGAMYNIDTGVVDFFD